MTVCQIEHHSRITLSDTTSGPATPSETAARLVTNSKSHKLAGTDHCCSDALIELHVPLQATAKHHC
jgi:hypothetical protein